MNLEHFENKLNQKFEEYQPSVADDKIWVAIEDQIPKEKTSRRFAWWLFFGALGLILIGVGVSTNISKKDQIDLESHNTDSQYALVGSDSVIEDANEDLIATKEDVNASEFVIQDQDLTSEVIASSFENLDGNLAEQIDPLLNMEQGVSKMDADSELRISKGLKLEQSVTADSEGIQVLSDNRNQVQLKLVSLLTIAQTPIEFLSIQERIVYPRLERLNKDIASKERHRSSIGFSSSYMIPSASYSSLNPELLRLRQESEETFEAVQFTMHYEYAINNWLSIGSGLRYMINNWQSTHTVSSEESVESFGLSYSRVTSTTISRIGNDKAFSIPLILTFKPQLFDKLSVHFGLGIEQSFLGRHTGFEADLEGIEYDITTDINGRYENTIGNHFIGFLGVSIPLSPTFDLQCNLETKRALSDFQTNIAEVSKRYNFYGLTVGVKINL